MIATSRIELSDLARQKRLSTDLSTELTPEHTVEQAIEYYLERSNIPDRGQTWTAFSRGVRLDKKARLADLPEADTSWTVAAAVSAGAR